MGGLQMQKILQEQRHITTQGPPEAHRVHLSRGALTQATMTLLWIRRLKLVVIMEPRWGRSLKVTQLRKRQGARSLAD